MIVLVGKLGHLGLVGGWREIQVWQQNFGDSEVAVLTNRVECKKQKLTEFQ